ncbi:MAG: UDP-N-acetylmuramate dehydrogenase [Dermabacter sp.]|nr:UDP-N-acetylmuramate dehydrogenase [Dermabacter sp.]
MKLSELTSLRLGGEIEHYVPVHDEASLIAAVKEADDQGRPLLVLGGGSNLVASDAPFTGTVVHTMGPTHPVFLDATCEISGSGEPTSTPAALEDRTALEASCGGAIVEYFAGTAWDDVVAYAVDRGMVGIEALSGIPGTVGATPIQNVGAYGQEVSQTITRVRTWDRVAGAVRTFFASDCGFAYRDSIFKRTPMPGVDPAVSPTGRYVVLAVTFQHRVGDLSAPIAYAELAKHLGVQVGQRAPMREVRDQVLAIRAAKGMVLNTADHDTWSAGSFFTNPILDADDAARLPEAAPRFETPQGIKTSAAWLITNAGFERGFTLTPERAGAALSTKHSLALTNRGEATSADVVALASHVRARVHEEFGIWLEPEPVRLGLRIGD